MHSLLRGWPGYAAGSLHRQCQPSRLDTELDFAQDDKTEGYLKGGPVSVAEFELGEDEESD